jgi:hypothetical protein
MNRKNTAASGKLSKAVCGLCFVLRASLLCLANNICCVKTGDLMKKTYSR